MNMPLWKVLYSKQVFTNPWYSVRQDQVLNHNGKPLTYNVVAMHSPSVIIVAMDQKGEVLLQKGYRYTLGQEIWEIPAGHSDGEDLLQAAKRELLEETGLASDNWTKLGEIYSAVGIGNIPATAFIARDVHIASDERDPDEAISDQTFFSLDEITVMARNGELVNASMLSALYLAEATTTQ